MRKPLGLGVVLLGSILVLGWYGTQAAIPAPQAKEIEPAKLPADDRDDLAAKLLQRVTFEKPIDEAPLKEVLEFLSDKYTLTILVDPKSFREMAVAAVAADDGVLNQRVSMPAVKNVRLSTVLKHLVDQIDGVYLLYPDHIKIVSITHAITLTRPPLKDYMAEDNNDAFPAPSAFEIARSIPLVHANFKETPLQDALREIETRTNRTIMLAAHAGDKGKTPISARFTNVPVDTAVAALAESAGLKLARKGNVLLVTTKERAREWNPEPEGFGAWGLFGQNGFGLAHGATPQDLERLWARYGKEWWKTLEKETKDLEEMKTKIAQLEKELSEAKKPK